jgi:uncharacterized protein YgiM (DUF1202 family)
MSNTSRISAYSAAVIVFSLALGASGFEAEAGGGRPHQNLSGPPACAALQSGTPGYRDCVAAQSGSAKTKTITMDTQLKAEPNSSSKAVGVLNKGTQVALIERTANGFWCHVQSGGFSGYVPFEVMN